ncbi:hypothetical protein BHM03_00003194 [Ensete ventricosum]|nr:hypothetical protein BHM03_00003194 [Ensete ventricosum]
MPMPDILKSGGKSYPLVSLFFDIGANLMPYVPFCRILRWVEEEENAKKKDADLQYVILDMGGTVIQEIFKV